MLDRKEYYRDYNRTRRDKEKNKEYCKAYYRRNIGKRKAYVKQWRQQNPDKARAMYKRFREKYYNVNSAFLAKMKQAGECVVCGENHIACLQLHHVDPSKKRITIAFARRWSPKTFLKEVEKCVLLCANCHFKLHHEAKNNRMIGDTQ